MKTISSIVALALAASILPAFAQDAPPPAPNCPPGQFEKGHHRGPGGPMGDILESLTPAEKQQYLEARRKTRKDPAVEEAKKKAEEARQAVNTAVKAAMLKADPTLAPVIDKVEAAIKDKKEEREARHGAAPLP